MSFFLLIITTKNNAFLQPPFIYIPSHSAGHISVWIIKWKKIRQWFMQIKIEQSIWRKYANEKLRIEYKCLSQSIPWEEHIPSQRFRDLKIRWTSQSTTTDPCTQNQPRGLRARRPRGRCKWSNQKGDTERGRLEAAPHWGAGQNTSTRKEDRLQSVILHAAHSQEGSTNSQEQSPGQREGELQLSVYIIFRDFRIK